MPRKTKGSDLPKIVEETLEKYEEYKTKLSETHGRWKENQKWFEGYREYYSTRADWQPTIIANIIESNIRTVVAVLTDSKPIMRVVGMPYKKLGDEEIQGMQMLGQNLDNGLNHIWRLNNMHAKLKKIVLRSAIAGLMTSRIYWDSNEYDNLGEIKIEIVDPKYLFFDPEMDELNIENGSTEWFIYAVPKPMAWFNYHFPGNKVAPMTENENTGQRSNLGLYIEAYKADYEVEESKAMKDGKVYTKRSRKYPIGRKICIGTNTLLKDEPLDCFPFAVEPIADRCGEFLGEDDVHRQITIQNEINLTLDRLAQHIALSASRQSVGDDNCGVDQEEFAANAGKGGVHFSLEGGATVDDFHKHFEFLDNPTIEPELMQFPFYLKDFGEILTGVTKLIQGLAQKSERQTGFEIGKMLETATIRLRERAGHVETFIRQIGLVCLKYMQLYYKEERDLWSINERTNELVVSEGFKFPTETKITGEDSAVDFEFDIVVQPDSTMPMDLNSQANLAMQLKQMQVITNSELLKRLQYPDISAAMPDQVPGGGNQGMPPVASVPGGA
jgi:hypothetical protein